MRPCQIFLLALGSASLVSSCGSGLYCPNAKTDLVKLSPETRQWFTYVPKQTIRFRDEAGNVDTLTVAQLSDTVENYWQGDECPDRPQEVVRVRLVHPATADTIIMSGEFTNQLSIAKAPLLLTYFTNTHKIFPDNQPSYYSYSANVAVGTEIFSQVLTIRCPPCEPNLINELYIAEKTGVVAYRRQTKLWIKER